MNLRLMFGNVSIGKDISGNYKLWPEGVAVRTSGSDYVGYNKAKQLIDVTGDVIVELDFVYKAPVEKVEARDLLLVKDGPTPDVLFVETSPDDPKVDPTIKGMNPRTFRSEHYVPPRDSNGKPIYIKVFSPLTEMLSSEPLLQFMLAKGEGGHDSHALAALLYHGLNNENKLRALTPVFVSEKGLSSELLALKKLEKEVQKKP